MISTLEKNARECGNLTFAISPRTVRPYRDVNLREIERRDAAVRDSLVAAARAAPVRLLASLTSGYLEMLIPQDGAWRPGRLREQASSAEWLEANWAIFATHLDWPERRFVAIGLELEALSVAHWFQNWYEPGGLVNPSVSLGPLVRAIKSRLKKGELFVAFGQLALTSSVVFFHPADLPEVVAAASRSRQPVPQKNKVNRTSQP